MVSILENQLEVNKMDHETRIENLEKAVMLLMEIIINYSQGYEDKLDEVKGMFS